MNILPLYARALGLLGPERRLAIILVIANLALAAGQFAEPVLFGRIVDTLAGAPSGSPDGGFAKVLPLLVLWAAFGLFNIGAGVLVALNAGRLSHRRRLAVMAGFFEHVLSLPLAFHTQTHSGRALKVMSDGSLSLGGIWLTFARSPGRERPSRSRIAGFQPAKPAWGGLEATLEARAANWLPPAL